MKPDPAEKHRQHFSVFEPYIGRCLRSLAVDQLYIDNEPVEDSLGMLELTFDLADPLLLDSASDGETVIASCNQVLETGRYCDASWEGRRVELSDEYPGIEFIGMPLTRVLACVDQYRRPVTSGWVLQFCNLYIEFHNWGDQTMLLFNEHRPQDDVPMILVDILESKDGSARGRR